MADPFLGQLKLFAGNFAPLGWQFCDGSLLDISQNDALFNLLGTTYGGDGISTFAVPDLRGRVPIHPGTDTAGNSYQPGTQAGSETVALTSDNVPPHTHPFVVSTAAGTDSKPGGNILAKLPDAVFMFKNANPASSMNAAMIGASTGVAHENRQPYQALNYIIATEGIYPPQS